MKRGTPLKECRTWPAACGSMADAMRDTRSALEGARMLARVIAQAQASTDGRGSTRARLLRDLAVAEHEVEGVLPRAGAHADELIDLLDQCGREMVEPSC